MLEFDPTSVPLFPIKDLFRETLKRKVSTKGGLKGTIVPFFSL